MATMDDIETQVARLAEVIAVLNADERKYKALDAETLELVMQLRQDYPVVRVLDDGSIAAVERLISTTAVYLGMNRYGWESRYCYVDPLRALEVLCALKSEDDVPEGWISSRPERRAP